LAAAMLRDDLTAIFLGDVEESGVEVAAPAADTSGPEDSMLIDDLDLGVRSLNCLKREGVETVGDLLARSEQDLMCIPNFGRKSLDEVRERLEKNNLKLRGE
jgi:DNA-directed RNA polymerase subunit alpha